MKQKDRASTYQLRKKNMNKNGITDYDSFLRSDLWREIKTKSKTEFKNGGACCFCGATENIHLHHIRYGKNNFKKAIMKNILPACQRCHYGIHEVEKQYNIDTYRATLVFNIIYYPESQQFTWHSAPKERVEDRVLSMRIVEASSLPETLHHSLHASLSMLDGRTLEEFLEKYRIRKEKKRDSIMLGLFDKYLPEVRAYMKTLTTTSQRSS